MENQHVCWRNHLIVETTAHPKNGTCPALAAKRCWRAAAFKPARRAAQWPDMFDHTEGSKSMAWINDIPLEKSHYIQWYLHYTTIFLGEISIIYIYIYHYIYNNMFIIVHICSYIPIINYTIYSHFCPMIPPFVLKTGALQIHRSRCSEVSVSSSSS